MRFSPRRKATPAKLRQARSVIDEIRGELPVRGLHRQHRQVALSGPGALSTWKEARIASSSTPAALKSCRRMTLASTGLEGQIRERRAGGNRARRSVRGAGAWPAAFRTRAKRSCPTRSPGPPSDAAGPRFTRVERGFSEATAADPSRAPATPACSRNAGEPLGPATRDQGSPRRLAINICAWTRSGASGRRLLARDARTGYGANGARAAGNRPPASRALSARAQRCAAGCRVRAIFSGAPAAASAGRDWQAILRLRPCRATGSRRDRAPRHATRPRRRAA